MCLGWMAPSDNITTAWPFQTANFLAVCDVIFIQDGDVQMFKVDECKCLHFLLIVGYKVQRCQFDRSLEITQMYESNFRGLIAHLP